MYLVLGEYIYVFPSKRHVGGELLNHRVRVPARDLWRNRINRIYRDTHKRGCTVGIGSHGEGGQEVPELFATDVDRHAGRQSG